MSTININQLYNSVLEKKVVKYKTYDSVLEKCHQRIKRHAENLKLSCIYTIPKFIIGTPLYNFEELKQYIKNSLIKSGFKIKQVTLEAIYISWDLKQKNKSIAKKKETGFRNIQDYNPTGKFINNNNTMAIQNINNKLHLIKY